MSNKKDTSRNHRGPHSVSARGEDMEGSLPHPEMSRAERIEQKEDWLSQCSNWEITRSYGIVSNA